MNHIKVLASFIIVVALLNYRLVLFAILLGILTSNVPPI